MNDQSTKVIEENNEDVPGCYPVKCDVAPLLMKVPSTDIAIQWALAFLGCTRQMVTKPALVLDIDGTILLNKENGGARCVLHFGSLVRACVNNGITIFCVTARPEEKENREYTEAQLQKCSIQPVAKVFMRPPDTEYAKYKYSARRQIEESGYAILLTIGDQFADIALSDAPDEINDSDTYVGQLSDRMQFGIKLPSEFAN